MARELKNRLVNDNVEEALLRLAREHVRGRLIDIGCGTMPYREQLLPLVSEYVGIDHADSIHSAAEPTRTCSAYQIDYEDAAFDSAICTFVLEHLEEPEAALRECKRVLKPGGVAIYQAPFIWHIHEAPRDFYRFSKFGLEHLFKKAGFEIVKIEALSGFWLTFGQLFVYNLYRYNRSVLRWLRLIDMTAWILQKIAYYLDRWDRAEDWTHGYSVVARRPAAADALA